MWKRTKNFASDCNSTTIQSFIRFAPKAALCGLTIHLCSSFPTWSYRRHCVAWSPLNLGPLGGLWGSLPGASCRQETPGKEFPPKDQGRSVGPIRPDLQGPAYQWPENLAPSTNSPLCPDPAEPLLSKSGEILTLTANRRQGHDPITGEDTEPEANL